MALVVLALSLIALGCSDSTGDAADIDEGSETVDTTELGARAEDLAAALRENGMGNLATVIEQIDISTLVGDGDFTLLAPNDEAFLALAVEDLEMATDPELMAQVLRNHVVTERLDSAELAEAGSVLTESGNTLEVDSADGTLTIGEAEIVDADIEAGDGVIHVVNQVLVP